MFYNMYNKFCFCTSYEIMSNYSSSIMTHFFTWLAIIVIHYVSSLLFHKSRRIRHHSLLLSYHLDTKSCFSFYRENSRLGALFGQFQTLGALLLIGKTGFEFQHKATCPYLFVRVVYFSLFQLVHQLVHCE